MAVLAERGRRADGIKLVAMLEGEPIGNVHQHTNGTLRFAYEDRWRESHAAYPLSLSMPLTAREHGHAPINAFLWGLLPENNRTLEHYGRTFGVSAGNPVALLTHIGADCAGAVQLVPPDRVDDMTGNGGGVASVHWLSEEDVARELRTVRERGIAGTSQRTAGQFSLAGAQPKIALLEEQGRWGNPSGRTPTNRILKPPSREYAGFAENEHFCLALATELDLGAATSRVCMFDDEVCIVVDRFDRVRVGNSYHRVHQEDVCQASAVLPMRKYENEGGPGIRDVLSILRDNSRNAADDIARFMGVTILNWVLAATDAHAKNYALLHGAGGGLRLAPFYDITSYLPYSDEALHRVKLAMRIGGQYLVRRVNRASWEKLARENGLTAEYVLSRAKQVLDQLPDAVATVENRAIRERLDHAVIGRMSASIHKRVATCNAALWSSQVSHSS